MRGRKLMTAVAVLIGAAAGVVGSAGAASSDDDFRADIFRLLNAATDQCADLSITSTTGNEVVQEPCTGKPTEVWLAQQATPATFDVQLINQSSSLCMDLLVRGEISDGTPVVQNPCSAKLTSQRWEFVTAGGVPGLVKVVNRSTGQCLEVKDGSLAQGAPLQVSTCLDSVDHQVWFKIPQPIRGSPANVSAPATSPSNRDVRRTPAVLPAGFTLSNGCFGATLPIDCLITEPIVNQPQATYPLTFLPGDRVRVLAGGCVQTGGKGKTWKRYVDPFPAGNLYHGLVTIPGATNPLVRLSDIPPVSLVVGGRGGPLSLGYEDDNYSDNGYYLHDDGNGDQCLNSVNAFVRIIIT